MKRPYVWVYVFCLVLFVALCFLAHQFSIFPGDRTISLWLKEAVPHVLVPVTKAVTHLGFAVPAVITVVLLVIIFLFINCRLEATFLVVLPTAAGLFNEMIKIMVDRPRPDTIIAVRSFPSGHTTYAVVLGGFYLLSCATAIKPTDRHLDNTFTHGTVHLNHGHITRFPGGTLAQ